MIVFMYLQKLEILSNEAAMLQEKISRDASNLQSSLENSLSHSMSHQATLGDLYQAQMMENKDAVRKTIDAWKEHAERNAGNLQDALGKLMDLRYDTRHYPSFHYFSFRFCMLMCSLCFLICVPFQFDKILQCLTCKECGRNI